MQTTPTYMMEKRFLKLVCLRNLKNRDVKCWKFKLFSNYDFFTTTIYYVHFMKFIK